MGVSIKGGQEPLNKPVPFRHSKLVVCVIPLGSMVQIWWQRWDSTRTRKSMGKMAHVRCHLPHAGHNSYPLETIRRYVSKNPYQRRVKNADANQGINNDAPEEVAETTRQCKCVKSENEWQKNAETPAWENARTVRATEEDERRKRPGENKPQTYLAPTGEEDAGDDRRRRVLSSNSTATRSEMMATMMDDEKKVSEQKQVSHHAWGTKRERNN